MFASKAGAKLVIGIDMSNILDQAEKIVRANGFSEDGPFFLGYLLNRDMKADRDRDCIDQGKVGGY